MYYNLQPDTVREVKTHFASYYSYKTKLEEISESEVSIEYGRINYGDTVIQTSGPKHSAQENYTIRMDELFHRAMHLSNLIEAIDDGINRSAEKSSPKRSKIIRQELRRHLLDSCSYCDVQINAKTLIKHKRMAIYFTAKNLGLI